MEQLARFYEVLLVAPAQPCDEAIVEAELRNRVQARFVQPQFRGRKRFLRKVLQTVTGRCDFLAAHEPGLRRTAAEMAASGSFDAVFLSCVLLGRLPLPSAIPVIGDTHNVQFDVHRRTSRLADSFLRRQYARWQFHSTLEEEQRCARRVKLLLVTSERDKRLFECEAGIRDAELIPNGIDLSEFSPSVHLREPDTILFSGLMSYYPNQQAIRWFLDYVFPLVRQHQPRVKLIVAGAAPPVWLIARRSSNVEVTGQVPDMRPYIERASVMVAPLHIGGGTRVKILEAQAMNTPVVSTSVGCEGLQLIHGETILIADHAAAFASHVVRLLCDPELARRIASAAGTHVARHFDWNRIGERLDQVLQKRVGLVSRAECKRSSDSRRAAGA